MTGSAADLVGCHTIAVGAFDPCYRLRGSIVVSSLEHYKMEQAVTAAAFPCLDPIAVVARMQLAEAFAVVVIDSSVELAIAVEHRPSWR